MINKTLRSIEYINVIDRDGFQYFGCDQMWFGSRWKRMAGCGPSVAATLLLYLQKAGRIEFPLAGNSKADCTRLMNDVWEYVTPTFAGVNDSAVFTAGIDRFTAAHAADLSCRTFLVPKATDERAPLAEALAFIAAGLAADCPVAFLNLHNGEVKSLESWDWVTIVRLVSGDPASDAAVTFFDGDKAATIDLSRWYATSKKGGAFVYIMEGSQSDEN